MPYRTKKTLYIILCIVLLISLAVVCYHNATEKAYDNGKTAGYREGYDKGHDLGYDAGYYKGYQSYVKIKEEYNFYHNHAVMVTTTGKKYHKYNCYHIRNRDFYIYNTENAKAKGYTPCLDCYN